MNIHNLEDHAISQRHDPMWETLLRVCSRTIVKTNENQLRLQVWMVLFSGGSMLVIHSVSVGDGQMTDNESSIDIHIFEIRLET
jgi:hypothetical protein